ncbi:MAG: FAD-dependent urate hydroxylase [Candidatus Parcubacteria bacterium]|jgi:2-polyprenyl-6-methoxyphenol hydroxylase-like FAD-dependent oxidoreductase
MKILIVGAGIGGLTLAAFLKESSIEYDIVEKANNWNTQGFSIGLWNNGRHILAKLGILDRLEKEGTHIKRYQVRNGKGDLIREYDFFKLYAKYGLSYTQINRAFLHSWLLELVGKENIQLGVQVNSLKDVGHGVEVVLSNGQTHTYDLVVGADGIHSKIRGMIFGSELEKFDNWRVWYAWVDNQFKDEATVTEYVEPGEFIGIFDSCGKTLAVLIAPVEHTVWDDVKGRLGRLSETFKHEVRLDGFLKGLKDEDVMPTDLSRVTLKKFVKGRVVLAGDAAHGFEPNAGLGASMAMEDGYVLAAELMKVSGTYTIKKAIDRYQDLRRKRVKVARSSTSRMRSWSFIGPRWLRKTVDFFLPFVPQPLFTSQYLKLMKEEI